MTLGNYLIIILLVAVFLVLIYGVILMGIGGKTNKKHSNKLMIARVSIQGIILIILAIIYIIDSK